MFKEVKKLHILLILAAIAVSIAWFSLCFADMTDKGQLGGQDSNNNYSWRIDANHNLIPGTTNQNNIGSSSNLVAGLYVVAITASGNAVITGSLKVTGTSSLYGGINWDDIKAVTGKSINWTNANILLGVNGGVNWESLRTSFGNTSTSINWQAFGV